MKISYKCIVEKYGDNEFFVSFSDLEEAFTDGESLEEALFNAEEVLNLTLEGKMDEGLDIPIPMPASSNFESYEIYPSARIQSALLVRFTRSDKGKTTQQKRRHKKCTQNMKKISTGGLSILPHF